MSTIPNTMKVGPNLLRGEIDLDTAQETVEFHVGKNTVASVTAQGSDGTWSAGVLTLKWRLTPNDNWRDFSPALTITATSSYQFAVNVFGTPWLGVQVSTAESSVRVFVSVWAEGDV